MEQTAPWNKISMKWSNHFEYVKDRRDHKKTKASKLVEDREVKNQQ